MGFVGPCAALYGGLLGHIHAMYMQAIVTCRYYYGHAGFDVSHPQHDYNSVAKGTICVVFCGAFWDAIIWWVFLLE